MKKEYFKNVLNESYVRLLSEGAGNLLYVLMNPKLQSTGYGVLGIYASLKQAKKAYELVVGPARQSEEHNRKDEPIIKAVELDPEIPREGYLKWGKVLFPTRNNNQKQEYQDINEDMDKMTTIQDYVFGINDLLGSGEVEHFSEVEESIRSFVENLSKEEKVAVYKAYRAEMKENGDKPLPGETKGMAQIFGIRLIPKK